MLECSLALLGHAPPPGPGRNHATGALAGLTPGSSGTSLLVGLLVAGVGTDVVNATVGSQAVASVPAHQAGTGSGINNTSRCLGAAIGVTVVFVLGVHTGGSVAGLLSGRDGSALVCAAVVVAGAVLVGVRPRAD